MRIELIPENQLAQVVAREFEGVDAARKHVLVMSVRNAIDLAQLHKIFSENLSEQELAFYREIIVEHPEGNDAGAAAAPAQPVAPSPTPDAAAIAVPEGARAAASKATAARDK